jgi:hypothetical protein
MALSLEAWRLLSLFCSNQIRRVALHPDGRRLPEGSGISGSPTAAETCRIRFSAHAYRLYARFRRRATARLLICSGTRSFLPESIKAGDCLVVWKLDRLVRSLPHRLSTVTYLKTRGIGFRSLTEQMDTATPQGEFLFHVFGALASICRPHQRGFNQAADGAQRR